MTPSLWQFFQRTSLCKARERVTAGGGQESQRFFVVSKIRESKAGLHVDAYWDSIGRGDVLIHWDWGAQWGLVDVSDGPNKVPKKL